MKSNHGDTDKAKMAASGPSRCKRLVGVELSDVTSWSQFVELMTQPRDASSLAIFRIVFSVLMMIDIPQERGMVRIDSRFGDPNICHFPLFDFLQPLPVDWMYVVYLVMLVGAVGIFLGAFYRLSCLLFVVPYWYIFLLDKSSWNNHSYLYGLISFQLLFLDANRFWSVDALWNPRLRNTAVPLWNYALIRTQIFLVYFLAGLKKMDADWLFGYSMTTLAGHWVFDPFRLILSDDQIDLFIIHLGGFLLDLTAGFFLFLDQTRPYAFLFCGMFHSMNSQLFSIGMFPYAMIATMPLFSYADWPRSLISRLPTILSSRLLYTEALQCNNDHCVYSQLTHQQEPPKERKAKEVQDKTPPPDGDKASSLRPRHHLASCFFLVYIAVQLFLPFSHFLTKGYNSWTNGLYGYSWDMMVHSWHTQHVRLQFVDLKTGEGGYLSPDYFSPSSERWVGHGDMIKQFAACVDKKLKAHGYEESALYLDVWKSMNGRFSQRMWDPRVDIVRAPWSPFRAISWHLPLLSELSNWRNRVDEMGKALEKNEIDVAFVADFPGLFLENYVSEDFDNTTLEILKGKVLVELVQESRNVTLSEGEKMQIPRGKFHNIHTVSSTPSCYMYTFVNATAIEFNRDVDKFLNENFGDTKLSVASDQQLIPDDADLNMSDPHVVLMVEQLEKANEKLRKTKRPFFQRMKYFILTKASILQTTFSQTTQALGHILLGMDSVITTMATNDRNQDMQHHLHAEL